MSNSTSPARASCWPGRSPCRSRRPAWPRVASGSGCVAPGAPHERPCSTSMRRACAAAAAPGSSTLRHGNAPSSVSSSRRSHAGRGCGPRSALGQTRGSRSRNDRRACASRHGCVVSTGSTEPTPRCKPRSARSSIGSAPAPERSLSRPASPRRRSRPRLRRLRRRAGDLAEPRPEGPPETSSVEYVIRPETGQLTERGARRHACVRASGRSSRSRRSRRRRRR